MSEYDVLINKYNALNAGYDQLYPKPMKHANTHASGGTDPITPGDIGAYSKNETNTLLQNNDPRNWGLGGNAKQLTSADNLDNIRDNGWYWWYDTRPSGAEYNYCHMRVDNGQTGTLSSVTQTIYRDGLNSVMIRFYNGDTWITEYDNPPMELGKEYRTTERYMGKPVYVRLHDFGALPNNTAKTDNSPANWSIDQAICAYGTTVAGTIPSQNFGGLLVAGRSISLCFNTGLITIATDYDRSSLSATIFLKYTKTTD